MINFYVFYQEKEIMTIRFHINISTRKAHGFESLGLNYWEINRQQQNVKLIFQQNLQIRFKIEKVNSTIKFCKFKLVLVRNFALN